MARRQLGSVFFHLQKLLGQSAAGEMTDGLLLERFLHRGDEAAFAFLVHRHGGLVLRVCQRVLGDSHAAEDAFQATFLLLVRKAGSIRRQESLASWLYGVAYRVARKARTTVARRQHRETQLFDLPGALPEHAEGGELRRVLDEELLRLGDRFRAPLVLCYLQGKTYQEAAQELGWSEGSMSRRLAQARERLRQRLMRRGYALSTSALTAAFGVNAEAFVPALWVTSTIQLVSGSALASPAVLALAEGAMRPMLLTKMKAAVLVLLGAGLCSAGAGILTADRSPPHCTSAAPAITLVEPGSGEDCPQDEMELPNMMELEPEHTTSREDPPAKLDYDELERLTQSPPVPHMKRRDLRSEQEHRQALQRTPEIDLDADRQREQLKQIVNLSKSPDWRTSDHRTALLLEARADLGKLPLRKGRDCELDEKKANDLAANSRELRRFLSEVGDSESSAPLVAAALRINFAKAEFMRERFDKVEAAPTLIQMLMGEGSQVRRVLVEYLGRHVDPVTTRALAQLALYDLAPDVRTAAVEALRQRPSEEVRPLLLAGFRYPWAPVADHAAEALVALQDQAALPHLQRLVDQPNPAAAKEGNVNELVRINHLRNCMMCHAPAPNRDSRVNARVPTPGEPLPPPLLYYSPQDEKAIVVRADVTYLRQDFSTAQPVANAAPWPEMQRYDYLVRQRPATAEELKQQSTSSQPQREAVLWAMRELEAK